MGYISDIYYFLCENYGCCHYWWCIDAQRGEGSRSIDSDHGGHLLILGREHALRTGTLNYQLFLLKYVHSPYCPVNYRKDTHCTRHKHGYNTNAIMDASLRHYALGRKRQQCNNGTSDRYIPDTWWHIPFSTSWEKRAYRTSNSFLSYMSNMTVICNNFPSFYNFGLHSLHWCSRIN